MLSTWLENIFARLVGIQRKATVCGHWTVKEGFLFAIGDSRPVTLWNGDNKDPRHCLECLNKMTTVCSLCKKIIFPGDSVRIANPLTRMGKQTGIILINLEDVIGGIRCSRRSCSDLVGSEMHGILYPGDDDQVQISISGQ